MASINKSKAYRKYLKRKHAAFRTPIKIFNKAVQKAMGLLVLAKRKIIAGEANEVWEVTVKNNKKIIVRISHKGISTFKEEARVLVLCEKKGVPVPRVIFLGQSKVKNKKIFICIEEKVLGAPLDSLAGSLSLPQKHHLIKEAGRILSMVHSVRLSYVGWAQTARNESLPTWSAWIMKRMEERRPKLEEIGEKTGINSKKMREAMNIIESNRALYKIPFPRLLHNDYSLYHIFVKGDAITGIIDFENHIGGDPVYDLARWNLFHSPRELQWLMEGYKDKKIFKGQFAKKLLLYKLHLELRHITYYTKEENETGLRHIEKIFYKDLRAYKRKWGSS